MLKRKHYFIVAILIGCALVAGLFLMPGRQELALMMMKDKHFEEARHAYEEQLSNGTLSLEVATHLTDLYLQVGAIDKAIHVMEKYVAAHPDNIDARNKLGTLYQYAQRQDDYMRNLEEINKLKPRPENLKVLSDSYNFKGQYDKQALVLKELIKQEQGKDPKHFVDLANVQVAMRAYPDAIATLEDLRKTHPDHFDFNECALLVSLLLDNHQQQEAFNIADQWIQAHHNDDESAQLINTLHFKGSAEMASSLMSRFSDDQINSSPPLLEEYVLLQIAAGKEEQAFERLKTLHDNSRLPPSLNRRLMFMAESRGDKKLAHSLLAGTDLTTYSESELLSLIVLAEDQKDPELLAGITRAFPEATNDNTHPVVMAGLAVSNHWASADSRLTQLDSVSLSTEQTLQMANLCAHSKRYDCTDHLITRLPPMDKLSDAEVAFVGDLYYLMHSYDKGYNYLRTALQTRKSSPVIEAVEIQFAAARGEDAEVRNWLANNPNEATPRLLTDLYFASINNGHLQTAISVAEIYHSKYDTSMSRSLLANAYIKGGRYEDGVRLLRGINPRTQDDENNYLTALTKLAPRNPQYRSELAQYASNRLHSGASGQQKLALVYALINARQTEIAMPYIRELALQNGGEWALLYADQLEKEGKYDEARRFWLRVAEQPSTTSEQKESIAFALLDHGDKPDAERLFIELAQNSAPDSDEVKGLLYLWGPRPNEKQMGWLEDRYMRATAPAEKQAWVKLYADYASSDDLIGFVHRHPESLNNQAIAEAYFQVLATNGKLSSTRDAYVAYTKRTGNVTLMNEFTQAAVTNGLAKDARMGYETIASVDKTDYIALREAGVLAYSQADYVASKEDLGQYINHAKAAGTNGDPYAYRAFFYYGELQRHDNHTQQAKPFYTAAIGLIRNSQTPEALSMKAQSQIWSGDVNGGIQTFELARRTYPDNEDLRSDYISTLLDMHQYDAARQLLPTSPAHAPRPTLATAGFPGFDQPVKSYTLMEKNNELLVQFVQPLKAQKPSLSQSMMTVPGVGYASEGYDTLLMGVKPGYKFRINNQTQMASVQIIPDPAAHPEDDNNLRYTLFSARIDLETGHVYNAAKTLNGLLPQYKDNAQVLGFLANAENYGGNWPQAETLLQTAHSIAPDDQDVLDLYRNARREHAQNVTLDYEWVKIGQDRENITTLKGYVDATKNLQVGANLQDNFVQVRGGRLADGRIGDFSGNREAGELYGLYHMQNGQYVRVAVFGNNEKAGVGGYYHFVSPLGETLVTGEWRKPYWEIAEAAYDDATRSRLAIQQIYKPSTRWTLSVEPSLNRYDTAYTDDVLDTFGLSGTAVYRLFEGEPFADVGYMLDAEYDRSQKQDFDQFGDYSRLLPQNSYEIHSLFTDIGYDFSQRTYGDIMIGAQYDRMGGSIGPMVEGKITHEFNDKFDMQLRAYYGLDTTNTQDELARMGAYARYRF